MLEGGTVNRRGIAAGVLVVVLMATSSTIPALPAIASTTLRVPADHATIQAAIDAASPGDTIEIAPGTYVEQLVVDEAVSLVAQSFDPADPRNNSTILDGGSGPAVVSIPSGVAPSPTFTGLVLRNAKNGIVTKSPMVVQHCYLAGTVDSLQYGGGAGGVASDNVFVASGDDSIDINRPVVDVTIRDNAILGSRGDGLEIRLNDDAIAETAVITIRDNRIVSSRTDGIQLIDYFEDTNRVFVIEGNLIRDSGKAGLGLLDNGESGEDFRAASIRERIHVFHNTFVGNDHGISGGDNLIAVNNIFQGHQLALKNVDADSIASHNLFWDNIIDFQDSSVDESTSVFDDPLLDGSDRLAAGSPAIDTGTAHFEWLGEVVMDRPVSSYVGAAPDLGWHEHGESPNRPPVIDSVDIAPATPITTDLLAATVDATDPDGDGLTFSYQWQKDGQDLSGATSSTLDLSEAGMGDRGQAISVRVGASDGSMSSEEVTSGSVTIANAPPVFGQDLGDRAGVETQTVSLPAPAVDLDADAVTYEATGLPPGLGIEPGTGLISGTIAEGAASGSPYAVEVTARDGPGALGTDTFTWVVTLAGVPAISSFEPASGSPGMSVTINGSGFIGLSQVMFDAAPASFTVDSDAQLTAIVPAGASSGPISVTGPGGTATTGGSFTVTTPATVTVKDFSFKPGNLTIGHGQVARWMFQGPSPHTVTDSIGLGAGGGALFDSGPRTAGERYEFVFAAAGSYPYASAMQEPVQMTGTIKVPVVVVPTSGTTQTEYSITWASAALPGFRFSVQHRFRPQGSSTWSKWSSFGSSHTAGSATFVPDRGAGTYAFRSRLLNQTTGRTSHFSSRGSITVT